MDATAIAAASLKPTVQPLLSRCFARCYFAVPPLFFGLASAQKRPTHQRHGIAARRSIFAPGTANPSVAGQFFAIDP
ncbi:MAG TPA: hypothetical protein VM782_21365 [Stellaceae bacterium]|nr:hypothetical protein [Stellaceae bacterium]